MLATVRLLLRLLPILFLPATLRAASGDDHAARPALGSERPHIVWLVSEDNASDYLRPYDAERGTAAPAIESLARDGILFRGVCSQAPVCSVARTTLMTSCFAPRIGAQFHRRTVAAAMPGGLRMFPYYLRHAGYYTTNRQKTDYNVPADDEVWDESSAAASWRDRAAGQPFFHMQTFTITHESSLHFPPSDVAQHATIHDPQQVRLAPYHPDTPLFRYTHARYLDRIQEMDQAIARTLQELSDDGAWDDTILFYFGDHGGVLPRGKGYVYESGLRVPLVVRVPEKWRHLVQAAPGSQIDGTVNFVDLGPTVLRLAGVPVPQGIDGTPVLGPDVDTRRVTTERDAFGYADRLDEKVDLVRSLRRGKWKYIRNYLPLQPDGLHNEYRYKMAAYREWRDLYVSGGLNETQRAFFEPRSCEQLFDLEHDPHEVRNLAADPAHRERLLAMRAALTAWQKSLPDLSFFPESVLVRDAFAGTTPVEFGQRNRERIHRLIDTADLTLLPRDQALPLIREALEDADPWVRYWALIAANTVDVRSDASEQVARQCAEHDAEPLVRVRAAEYLGRLAGEDPGPWVLSALRSARTPVEANLILNSLVALREGDQHWQIPVTERDIPATFRDDDLVQRRLRYLRVATPASEDEPRQAAAPDQLPASRPNIVLILADDMGYGDIQALNPGSRIATPQLNRLAAAGVTFTDGHSPSAVCTPTRYGLLTGRYAWRGTLQQGVLGGYSPPLLEPGRRTIGDLAAGCGYQTAAIGKWHLGMRLPTKRTAEGVGPDLAVWQGDPGIDFQGVIPDGPCEHGFGQFFGICASLDMAPYVYVRNHRFAAQPTSVQPAMPFPHFVRSGPRSDDFVFDTVLDRLVEEAVQFIQESAPQPAPYLLYLPLSAPHKPTLPAQRFRGKSGLGEYGDFVMQVDDAVGQVLQAVAESGEEQNTLVIYTSDNGSYMVRYAPGSRPQDHRLDAAVQGYFADQHTANGPYRGTKADIYEAGHRVPLLMRWPGVVQPGTRCDVPVCLTDIFATLADGLGVSLGNEEAEDSCSWLPILRNQTLDRGAPIVHHSVNGMFALRSGEWKLIAGNGSGGREQPVGKPFERPYQLFRLADDPSEANDLAAEFPEQVELLVAELERLRQAGRSVTRADAN